MKGIIETLGAGFWGDTDCDMIMFYSNEMPPKRPKTFSVDDEDYPTQEQIEFLKTQGYECMII